MHNDLFRISGKRSGLFPVRFGHAEHAPAAGSKFASSGVEWRMLQVEMDFALNPLTKLPHACRLCFAVLQNRGGVAIAGKALREGALLVLRLEPRDFERMRNAEPVFVERGLHGGDQVGELQSATDVRALLPTFAAMVSTV